MTPQTLTLTAPRNFLPKTYLWHTFGSEKSKDCEVSVLISLQKELKWPKSDSKVTLRVSPQNDPKWLKSDSKMTQKWGPESLLSQF